jgi:HNH endonuclease/AP2 domain-containing protein
MMCSLLPYSHEGNAPFITIPLTQGYKTIVDLEDADLAQLKWQINRGRYAMRRPRIRGSRTERLVVLMHRVILERHLGRPIQDGMIVDHINGDGLDNRRTNLREATPSLNAFNRHRDRNRRKPVKAPVTPDYTIDQSNPNVAIIPISQGKHVLVDLVDVDLACFKWAYANGRYAMRRIERQGVYQRFFMHRIILERKLGRPIAEGMVTDHINGDGLNNRRENLREATQLQNMHNLQMRRDNTAQYKGVRRITTCTWEARLDERIVGYYDTAEDASFAYDKAALEEYGEFAHLNHPLEQVQAWMPPDRHLRKTNTSGYRGVRKLGKDHWYAQIHINKEQNIYLGTFNSPEDAARVYDRAAVDHWGIHAKLNFPLDEVLAWDDLPRPVSSNTSGYRGVTQIKRSGKWQASYRNGKKLLYLGTYDTAEDAAKAYDRAVIRLKGDRATTNFLLEDYDNGYKARNATQP